MHTHQIIRRKLLTAEEETEAESLRHHHDLDSMEHGHDLPGVGEWERRAAPVRAEAHPMSIKKEWNLRYVAYASAHGRSPGEMLDHDSAERPGGSMLGYMQWIDKRRREFLRETGRRSSDKDQEAFTQFLKEAR